MIGSPLDDVRARLGADPSSTALLLDFDGTLAPIVDDPASAVAVEGAVDLLDRLATRFARVAVVSGRPRAFLLDRVGPRVDVSGLYGLETRIAGVLADHAEAERWREVIDAVVERAADPVDGLPPGALVEPKGLSLTVHWRQHPEVAPAVTTWADAVASATGLERREAKQSVELHPPLEVDKGTSVLDLAGGCRTVAYLGDDIGDLPAFAALDELGARGVDVVKIAVSSPELPDEIARQAEVVVDGPRAVVELLGPLAEGA